MRRSLSRTALVTLAAGLVAMAVPASQATAEETDARRVRRAGDRDPDPGRDLRADGADPG